jgi:hypothetical protein
MGPKTMIIGHVNMNKAESRARSEWIRVGWAVKGIGVSCAALVITGLARSRLDQERVLGMVVITYVRVEGRGGRERGDRDNVSQW